jgi:hypothetical protein
MTAAYGMFDVIAVLARNGRETATRPTVSSCPPR